MLSLGLPSTARAAVMLTAFVSYGIQPGPTLFDKEPLPIWTLIASLFIGNFMLLALNLPLAPLWAKLLRTPGRICTPASCSSPPWGRSRSTCRRWIWRCCCFGLMGLMMRRFGLPVLPLIIGVIRSGHEREGGAGMIVVGYSADRFGAAALEHGIVDARLRGTAVLVIGIRHRNPVGKLLLGSVSQRLILECDKPVLAVKPR